MVRTIIVELTIAEAEEAESCIGYSLEAPMCWERYGESRGGGVKDHARSRSAERAQQKIRDALARAGK